ncbi:MAG: type II toxin-antitoxin system VapC family toxin [Flavobacteriales bacterium]
MIGERVLADTNILVYHLGGVPKATSALQGAEVHISFITEIELQSKPGLPEEELVSIRAALANYSISDVNPSIKIVAAKLRREYGLKLADAIIAATALHLDIPLLTADSGFDRLDKLVKVRKL